MSLKEWRLSEIKKNLSVHSDSIYKFYQGDISDRTLIDQIFAEHKPNIVVNLAAQSGVRYSITNPDAYVPVSYTHLDVYKRQGAYIKKCRNDRDMTQRDLADATKISNAEISRIESGKRISPAPEALKSIAFALQDVYKRQVKTVSMREFMQRISV